LVPAGFFAAGAFFVAVFGLVGFFAADFFAAVDLGFFGVVAFFVFGLAAVFVPVFFAPAGLAALVFLALVCVVFFVFVAVADFGAALDFGFDVFAILTFFGLAAVVVVDEVVAGAAPDVALAEAELLVLVAVAAFLAGFVPADFERARFFVPEADVEPAAFFVLVVFFVAGFAPSANLNEPLAPLPLVCLKYFALIPFLRANLRC